MTNTPQKKIRRSLLKNPIFKSDFEKFESALDTYISKVTNSKSEQEAYFEDLLKNPSILSKTLLYK